MLVDRLRQTRLLYEPLESKRALGAYTELFAVCRLAKFPFVPAEVRRGVVTFKEAELAHLLREARACKSPYRNE